MQTATYRFRLDPAPAVQVPISPSPYSRPAAGVKHGCAVRHDFHLRCNTRPRMAGGLDRLLLVPLLTSYSRKITSYFRRPHPRPDSAEARPLAVCRWVATSILPANIHKQRQWPAAVAGPLPRTFYSRRGAEYRMEICEGQLSSGRPIVYHHCLSGDGSQSDTSRWVGRNTIGKRVVGSKGLPRNRRPDLPGGDQQDRHWFCHRLQQRHVRAGGGTGEWGVLIAGPES